MEVNHINLIDDSGQVYCHLGGDIDVLDGEHVAKSCWICPYWVGLAGGYGVECSYKDENLGRQVSEMTYRNAEDARDHAPEPPEDPNSIASKDGIKMMDLRKKHMTDQEVMADEVEAKQEEAEATDEELALESEDGEEVYAEDEMGEEMEPVLVEEEAERPTIPMKKATTVDVLAALATIKHLPGKHDQRTHAGIAAGHIDAVALEYVTKPKAQLSRLSKAKEALQAALKTPSAFNETSASEVSRLRRALSMVESSEEEIKGGGGLLQNDLVTLENLGLDLSELSRGEYDPAEESLPDLSQFSN